MKGSRINNEERRLWILNDAGLYNWQRSSRLSMKEFIKQNKEELDQIINEALHRNPSK